MTSLPFRNGVASFCGNLANIPIFENWQIKLFSDIIYPRWKSASFLFAENTLGLGFPNIQANSGIDLDQSNRFGPVQGSQLRKICILWCSSSFNFISSWYAWLWRRLRIIFKKVLAIWLVTNHWSRASTNHIRLETFSATIWYHLFVTLTYVWPLVLAITADSG